MFKNNYYKKNKDIIIVPKHIDKHDVKQVVKPNVNKNNTYENIRSKIENNESEKISNPEVKKYKNKLNIV